MRLIGTLASPYVRRVAISLEMLGIAFRHEPLSVFTAFEAFQRINPVVKAPTLVCENGEVLMDSSLILQFVEATHGRSLWSPNVSAAQHEFAAVGLALAACEKSVQILYEQDHRPTSSQHTPWLERLTKQLLAAYAGLEREIQAHQAAFFGTRSQASVTAAVAWRFTQLVVTTAVPASAHPNLVELSDRMERLPEFLKWDLNI